MEEGVGPRAGEGLGREADVEGVAQEGEEAREGRVGRREREEEVLCAGTKDLKTVSPAIDPRQTRRRVESVAHLGRVQSRKDGERQPERADEQPEPGELRRVGSDMPPSSLQPWMDRFAHPFWLWI